MTPWTYSRKICTAIFVFAKRAKHISDSNSCPPYRFPTFEIFSVGISSVRLESSSCAGNHLARTYHEVWSTLSKDGSLPCNLWMFSLTSLRSLWRIKNSSNANFYSSSLPAVPMIIKTLSLNLFVGPKHGFEAFAEGISSLFKIHFFHHLIRLYNEAMPL